MRGHMAFALSGFLLAIAPALADAPSLPTPEQFDSLLTTCAAGAKLDVDGKLRGSLKDIYSSNKSEIEAQKFVRSVAPTFLEKVPDADKAKVYELYVTCIQRILSGQKEFSQVEIPSVIELPSQITTFGKPLNIKAKTILAKDSVIRSFDGSSRGSKGVDGAAGNNGNPGANGSGGQGGNGTDGGSGMGGLPGASAGEIGIEADEFIGQLHIVNSGMAGGNGGQRRKRRKRRTRGFGIERAVQSDRMQGWSRDGRRRRKRGDWRGRRPGRRRRRCRSGSDQVLEGFAGFQHFD